MLEMKELVLHPIQLIGVELIECNLFKNVNFKEKAILDDMSVNLKAWSKLEEEDRKIGYTYLNVIIDFESSVKPFSINITYRGVCLLDNIKCSESQFKAFLEAQGVKLLWPYIKPAVSDFMIKMDIDPLKLPTLDVLKTMERADEIQEVR